MAALIESIGGRCRILIASSPKKWHAYTEVFMGYGDIAKGLLQQIYDAYSQKYEKIGIRSPEGIHYHEDLDSSVWLNLDWTAKHAGGSYFKGKIERVIYPR